MPGDVRRLTVHGAGRRVDLSVPAGVPIVELIPALAGLCHVDRAGPEATPPAWGLARIGGPPLGLSASLDQAGVADGEVLCLVDTAVWRAPAVREAAEVVSDAMGASRGWDASARTAVLAALAAVQLLAAAALGGWSLTAGAAVAVRLAAAAAGATVAALAAYPLARALAPAAALAGGCLAAGAAAVALGARPAQAAAVLLVVAVAALRVLPPLLSRRLAHLDVEVRPDALARAARGTRRLLASLSAGMALTVVGAAAVLAWSGDLAAGALAAAAAVALLLQVPAQRFLLEALPLAVAAGTTLLVIELTAAARLPLLAAILLAFGAGVAAAASFVRRPPGAAQRWAEPAWPLVDAAIAVLALAELGVFAALSRLVRTVLG
jgi:WXG100 protein secretion system (Wss), protein YukD